MAGSDIQQQAASLLANASTSQAKEGEITAAKAKFTTFIGEFESRSTGPILDAVLAVHKNVDEDFRKMSELLTQYAANTNLFNQDLEQTAAVKAAKIAGSTTAF